MGTHHVGAAIALHGARESPPTRKTDFTKRLKSSSHTAASTSCKWIRYGDEMVQFA
jgi:hypothetical protein